MHRRVLYENALSIVLIAVFSVLLAAQVYTGWQAHNEDRQDHGLPSLTLGRYVASGHFIEATAENWESEFLQMAAFVWLTAFLVQKGSPESRSVAGSEKQDREPNPERPGAPWPVRRGGVALVLYSHSLTLTFLLMFFVSFLFHAAGGARAYSQERLEHGEPPLGMLGFMATYDFWFQSMQNWQSEFLAIAMMVILSVFLRQKGSPESKPVDAPHWENE
jgi:hypothetical protein